MYQAAAMEGRRERAVTAFKTYSWPGNVRALENIIEQVVVTSTEDLVFAKQLPAQMKLEESLPLIAVQGIIPLKEAVESVEKQLLCTAINKYKTSRKVAAALEVNQTTIIRKIHKYGLNNSETISKHA